MLQVQIDNKNGSVWDISDIVADLSWSTSRIGKAGKVDLTFVDRGLYQDRTFTLSNGDILTVRMGNVNVFLGYIFSIDRSQDEAVKVTAYDQTRYLLNQDKLFITNFTASELLSYIADKYQLKLGKVEDTVYKIPKISEGTLLDMICNSLTLTLHNYNQKNFFLLDDFGGLSIQASEDHVLDFVIGDQSLMTGYSSQVSIDSDTYNQIKLYRDNKETGKREIYMAKDSVNIAKWGLLQLYQSVDEEMNEAQIGEMLNMLAAIKNRETRSLKIEALGDIRVRSGYYLRIIISDLGINQRFIVDECTHKFSDNEHTMSINLRVI